MIHTLAVLGAAHRLARSSCAEVLPTPSPRCQRVKRHEAALETFAVRPKPPEGGIEAGDVEGCVVSFAKRSRNSHLELCGFA